MNLRKAAEGQPCVVCGSQDGTTVLHHVRVDGSGGIGKKPEDFPYGIDVCHQCHTYFHEDGRADWKMQLIAVTRQMKRYLAQGRLVIA